MKQALALISDTQITDSLATYGIHADQVLCDRIRIYVSLLLAWNEKLSLTTITNSDEILRFHFGESLFAISTASIQNGRLADVGSGAGFPGLPLAMALPDISATLVESNLKKAAFLGEVIRTVGIPNASVMRMRMEQAGLDLSDLDYVTARAVGEYEQLLAWSRSRLRPTGKIVFWISQSDAARIARLGGWEWNNPVPIPKSRSRSILVGYPIA